MDVKKRKLMKFVLLLIPLIIIFIGIQGVYYRIRIDQLMKYLQTDYKSTNHSGLYQLSGWKIINLDKKKNTANRVLSSTKGIGIGFAHINNQNQMKISVNKYGWCFAKDYNSKKVKMTLGKCPNFSVTYDTKSEEQIFVAPKSGNYKIEAWGARGGNSYAAFHRYYTAGKGAYASGVIYLKKNEILYLNVGSKGEDSSLIKDPDRRTTFYYPSAGGAGGYNGGGRGFDDPQTDAGGGGGGATDVRLVSGTWDDFESLKSRILVAGGAGGNSRHNYDSKRTISLGDSGAGGTLKGLDSYGSEAYSLLYGKGSTQTSGYKFGIGQNGIYCKTSLNGMGGGAGGYFGSMSGLCPPIDWIPPLGAGGGSSYVSGCKGCKAIDARATEENVIMTDQAKHYSGKIFKNIVMKSGNEKMPNPKGGTMTGNNDNGYLKISFTF